MYIIYNIQWGLNHWIIKGSLVRKLSSYGRWLWLAFTPSCQPHHHANHPSSSSWKAQQFGSGWIDGWKHSGARNPVFFPECLARVPVSLWGSGGWGCVRSTLRLCSQPSATVRNRLRATAWGPCGRAYGKFCERGHFGSFKRRVALFRVAGVALLDVL